MNRKQQTTGYRPAVKSTIPFAATAATFAIALVAPLGAQAAWQPSMYHEVHTNGITYKVMLADNLPNNVCLGTNNTQAVGLDSYTGTRENANCTVEDIVGSLIIPDKLMVNGAEKIVSTIAARGFWGQTALTGVVFPAEFSTFLYGRTFKDCTSLQALWFKGPPTVASGTQNYIDIAPSSNGVGRKIFTGCNALKYVLVGPNAKFYTSSNRALSFEEQTGCRIFLPTKPGNTTWEAFETTKVGTFPVAGSNPIIVMYGPGQELDIEGADGTGNGKLTFTPNTAHALTNVLAAASVFKTQFGVDSKVVITNAIEAVEGTITSELLANVSFDSLNFAVNTQAQLDMVLDAVPVETPLSIDPTGATESLTVITENRKIYVLLPTNGTYKLTKGGLMIIVK